MNKKALYPLLLLLLSVVSPSCSSDISDPIPPVGLEVAGYLQLAITNDTPTRANPTGGESGDGLEHGRDEENTIHNLNVFVYNQDEAGLDRPQKVQWSKYVDSQTVDGEVPNYPIDRIYHVTIPLSEDDMKILNESRERSMRLFIVANTGKITEMVKNLSVNGIASYLQYGKAWTVDKDGIQANSYNFVMSSAFNGVKRIDTYKQDGLIIPGEGIYTSEVHLERVAARIDLELATDQLVDVNVNGPEGDYSGKGIQYAITDSDVDSYLTVTDIVPVNLMQKNSYLLKQVSEGTELGENINVVSRLVAGDETTDAKGVPTNYVITPTFLSIFSTPANKDYFDKTGSDYLRENYNTEIGSNNYKIDKFGNLLDIPVDNFGNNTQHKALLITYANENTVHEKFQISNTEAMDGTVPYKASDYLTGLLFRAQYHPEKVYTTGVIGDDAPSEEYKDGNDFWLFRTVGANNTNAVEEKYNIYFASENALNEYVATLPAVGRYETVYYPDGICYYNVWIKHANIDDSDENFPMKYGIVRNNIYRISLNFNGIGQPTPEITEPRNVTSRIYVIKWNFRPQKPIIM